MQEQSTYDHWTFKPLRGRVPYVTLYTLLHNMLLTTAPSGVEALSIGANNVFEPKCRVPKTISISDWTCIGAGCTVLPVATFSDETEEQNELQQDEPIEILPSRTMVYGADCERRIWSGEARLQAQGLHVKQLDALHEVG